MNEFVNELFLVNRISYLLFFGIFLRCSRLTSSEAWSTSEDTFREIQDRWLNWKTQWRKLITTSSSSISLPSLLAMIIWRTYLSWNLPRAILSRTTSTITMSRNESASLLFSLQCLLLILFGREKNKQTIISFNHLPPSSQSRYYEIITCIHTINHMINQSINKSPLGLVWFLINYVVQKYVGMSIIYVRIFHIITHWYFKDIFWM